MKKLIALAAALVMAVMLPSTALAQTSAGGAAQNTGTVSVTFELNLSGEVPGWQNFAVEHYVDGKPVQTPLCTTGADVGPAGPFCEAGGVYTVNVQVPAGAPVAFDFLRHDTRTAPERFFNGTRTFAGNTIVEASYNFPGAIPIAPSTTNPSTTSGVTAGVSTTSATTTDAAPADLATTSVATTDPAPVLTGQEATVAATEQTAPTTSPSGTPVGETTGATSGREAVTAVRILPDTGGSSLLAVLGGSLLLLSVAGFAIRKKI